jgi:hypothetical protein
LRARTRRSSGCKRPNCAQRESAARVNDFSIIKGALYGCPTSFNRLTPAWYINESKKPNARCDENYYFRALRNVDAGEELTVDYGTFSDLPK